MMQTLQALAAGPLDHLPTHGLAAAAGIADLSALARVGFRGRHAADVLQRQGYQLPDRPNQACWQVDGTLVARLSQTEYLLLATGQEAGKRLHEQEQTWRLSERACYLLPRQDTHAWIGLQGGHLPEMMARLCAVDLSPQAFAPGSIAQTSVARATAIVINASRDDDIRFWLLVDYSLAAWYWDVLQDTAAEFAPVSLP